MRRRPINLLVIRARISFPRGIPPDIYGAKSDLHRRAGGGGGTGHSSGKLREIREYSRAFRASEKRVFLSRNYAGARKVRFAGEGSYLETSRGRRGEEGSGGSSSLSHLTPSSRSYAPRIVSTSRIAMRRECSSRFLALIQPLSTVSSLENARAFRPSLPPLPPPRLCFPSARL